MLDVVNLGGVAKSETEYIALLHVFTLVLALKIQKV